VACRAAIPSPEEKNEIENDNEYVPDIMFFIILVLILVLVLRNGEGSCGVTAAR
jgi:hypothetical protein